MMSKFESCRTIISPAGLAVALSRTAPMIASWSPGAATPAFSSATRNNSGCSLSIDIPATVNFACWRSAVYCMQPAFSSSCAIDGPPGTLGAAADAADASLERLPASNSSSKLMPERRDPPPKKKKKRVGKG